MVWSALFKIKNTTKLVISGFILMICLSALFAGISLKENSRIAKINEKMYFHPFSVSNAVLEANADIIAINSYMKDVVLATNQNELELAISLVEKHEQAALLHFVLIKDRFLGDKKTVNAAFSAFIDWKSIRNEIVYLQRMNKHKDAVAIRKGKGAEHVRLLTKRMDVLIVFARDKAFEFKTNSQTSYENSISYLYTLLFFIILSSIASAFFVVKKIMKTERAREISEERFEGLFKNSVIPILSEDFSSVLRAFKELRMQGVVA